jgi:hypothetical protein
LLWWIGCYLVCPVEPNSLNALLTSQSPGAKLLGLAVVFFFFLPAAFKIAEDTDLTVLQRLGQLSAAIGQTCGTIGLAALEPEFFTGKKGEDDSATLPDAKSGESAG